MFKEKNEERAQRRKHLLKFEPIHELYQIQLERNSKVANDARLAIAKFLDATYHPLHSTNEPRFSAMLIIVNKTEELNESGGHPVKKRHFYRRENPEVTIISNT